MLPSPLWLSLLFDGCVRHFSLLFQTPFCMWRWFKWRWRRRWRQRQTAATDTATPFSWVAQEVAPLRPQGDVSCAGALHPLVPWHPEQNDRVLAPVVRDLRWSSTRLFPCRNGIVLNNPRLVYDLLLRWHIQGNCLCIQTAQNQFGPMALVAPVELQVQMEAKELPRVWLQHRRSDPNPTANIFQCVWCQFTAECFVQQAAIPSFAWR